MYDIKWIRENAEAFDRGRKRRGLPELAAHLISQDYQRRDAIQRLQLLQEQRNALSNEVGQALANKDNAKADSLKAAVTRLKAEIAGRFPECHCICCGGSRTGFCGGPLRCGHPKDLRAK